MRDEYPNLTFLSEQTVCTASGLYIYQTDGDSRVPEGEGSVRHRQGNCVLKKSFLSEKKSGASLGAPASLLTLSGALRKLQKEIFFGPMMILQAKKRLCS